MIKMILNIKYNKPRLIFDEKFLYSFGLIGSSKISWKIFEGYKLVEFNNYEYINIYPKNIKEFKKTLGFNILRRLMFRNLSNNGINGVAISRYSLGAYYYEVLSFLEDKLSK